MLVENNNNNVYSILCPLSTDTGMGEAGLVVYHVAQYVTVAAVIAGVLFVVALPRGGSVLHHVLRDEGPLGAGAGAYQNQGHLVDRRHLGREARRSQHRALGVPQQRVAWFRMETALLTQVEIKRMTYSHLWVLIYTTKAFRMSECC